MRIPSAGSMRIGVRNNLSIPTTNSTKRVSDMAQQNEIKLSQKDGVIIMEIQGDITVFSEPFLKEAYQSANDLKAVNVMLVFDSSAYINSGGIAILIQLLAEARKRKQQVGITGLSEHFKKIFNMVGITRFARIYQTLEEGLNGLSPP